jgi:hypothetical protein
MQQFFVCGTIYDFSETGEAYETSPIYTGSKCTVPGLGTPEDRSLISPQIKTQMLILQVQISAQIITFRRKQ